MKWKSPIFKDTTDGQIVWMSHGDRVENIPAGFEKSATSENSPFAAIANSEKNIYAFQFHPEVLPFSWRFKITKTLQNIFVIVNQLEYGFFCKKSK